MIRDYNLDLYRIDAGFNGVGGTREVDGFIENNNWRYHVAWVRVFEEIKRRFPKVELQCCHGGGGHLDWCALGVFHNTEMSDCMRQPRDLRILNNSLYSLPPEILLRCFGTECPGAAYVGSAETQFRKAVLSRPTFRGIAPYIEDLSPYLRSLFEKYVLLFKEKIRPMLPECRVYHHTGYQPLSAPSVNTILEYSAADGSIDFLVAYTMCVSGEGRMLVYPRGLNLGSDYKVTYDNDGQWFVAKGWQLNRDGVALEIPQNLGSEMLIFEEIKA
jgi:alpha-galactosidase